MAGQGVQKRGVARLATKLAARDVLVYCATPSLSAKAQERVSEIISGGVDWDHLLRMAEIHGVLALVHHNLSCPALLERVPPQHLTFLEQVHSATLARNLFLSSKLGEILAAFSRHSLRVIPLKGTVLAEMLYDNVGLRTIADIDILVPRRDLEASRALIRELGYRHSDEGPPRDHAFHDTPYVRETILQYTVELHWALDDPRLVPVLEEDLWRRSRPMQWHDIATSVLSTEDSLLFLATHLAKQTDELLKAVADVTGLVGGHAETIQWDVVLECAASWQAEIALHHALSLAKEMMQAPVPRWVLEALRPGRLRGWTINLLADARATQSPISWSSLQGWTTVLARALMMQHVSQATMIMTRQQGSWGAWGKLRAGTWMALAMLASFGRRLVGRIGRALATATRR